MEMEALVHYLIIVHATLGGISLLGGTLAMVFKKGGKRHKQSGRIFFFSLCGSSLLAIIISLLPGHYSPFLLAIGIFTLYLLLSGYRALQFKSKMSSYMPDRWIAIIMLITALAMIIVPVVVKGKINLVLSVFGGIGLISAIRDLVQLRKPELMKKRWMRQHLGNMSGAYIAAFTAFLVVNDFLPDLIAWLGPTVIGSIFIVFWNLKLRKQEKRSRIRKRID